MNIGLFVLLALGVQFPCAHAEDNAAAEPDLIDWGYYYVGVGATALVGPGSTGGAGTLAFRFHRFDPLNLDEVDFNGALDLGGHEDRRFAADFSARMSAMKGLDWARFGRTGTCGLAGFVGAQAAGAAFTRSPRHSTRRASFHIGMRAEPLSLLCYGSRYSLTFGPTGSVRVGHGDGFFVAGGGGKIRVGGTRVRFGAGSEAAWSIEGLLVSWDGTLDVLLGRRFMLGARVSGERVTRLREPDPKIERLLADPDASERLHVEAQLTAGVAF